MSKDNLSSLYNGLIKKGYSSDDIGDEATFRSKMADKENRKALYDYVSSRGDFRIGDYESYESRLSGKPEQEKPDIDVPSATAEQTAVPDETTVQDALPREQRKSLREQVGTGIPFAVPSESEMAAKFATAPTDDVNARLQKAAASGKLDTIINSEEEKNISQVFTPRPVVDASDIYKNYSDRFSLTERGKELNAELADISKGIQGKYMQEFMASDEFKKLQNSLKGQELDDAANEAFRSMYSAKIDSELRPYVKAFQDEAFARYETDLSRDLSAYQEKEKQKTKESIASDVSSLSASVNNLLDDNHRRLSSHAGSGGSAMSAIMGSRKYIQETEQDRKSQSQLEAAQKLLEESQNIIDEAGRKGKTSFVAGLGRGFADTAFNADNWLFGLPDIRDSKVLMDTLDKYDKGEALTESEQALMDAAVANMATNAYYYSDLGRGYKAGSVTGQSIPFMLEFAINPVSGSGSAIAKSILKYGMKKFGKSAVKNSAAKFAARLAGDAAAAAAMTGTSSLPRVAAGAIERAGGDIQLDETGTGYAGRTGQMGAGEALGKSFASTFLENQSEMVFNAFSGLGSKIWKSAEKYIPGGTAAIMDNAIMGKAGEIYRKIKSDPTFKEVARRTQFHGIGEEYLEEVYNNFANIPLGEMTLEEATDLDNNIDTFLGLAPTSVAFGVIGLGGLTAQKMQHRKKMKAAFGNMSRIERERLAKLEELGEKAGNEDIKNFIRETILDKDLSPEEKKAEIEYAYNLAVGNAIDDVEAAQQDEIQQSSLNASQEGAAIYAEHNPETMRQTVLRRELAEQKLIDAGFAAEDIERMKSTPAQERGQLLSSMNEASSQPVTDFFNAFDREEAMNEALDTAHEEEVSQARSMLQDIVLPNQTVTVIPLGQYGNEQAQYGVVVSGIDANGNPTQNNGAVVTYPVQVVNGAPDFSTIDKGNAVVAIPASYTDAMVFSPDDAFNGMLSAYQQDAAILEGTPISQGAQFPVMFDDGSMQNIIVAGTAPTGESVIVLPDGKTVNMPVEELSMRKRNAELAPIMAEQAEEEQVQQQAVQEAVTAGYSEEVKNLQPQAGEKLVIDGRNAAIKEVAPDGLIVDYISDSGDIMRTDVVPYEAYYDYKQTLFEQQNELTQQQTTGENVSSQPSETGTPDSTVSTTEGEAAEVTGIQQEAGYPMDENGEPDFLRMQPQQTVQLLADTFAEDAASFVSDRLSAAQKAAEKAAKKSPKALGFNERVKELSEIKQERESAAREIEYWQNISSLIGTEVQPQQVAQAPTIMEEAEDESRRNQERLASMTEEEIAAAQAKVQENIDKGKYESRSAGRKRIRYSEQDSEMGEAFTPMEHVLREIATGRIVFQWSDKGSTQGLGSHLGMSDSNKERQSLIWTLSNEGYTPEAAAEIIHGDMPAAMQELVTDQDVFNMILDAFSQYGSPSRMFEAAQQMHGNDLESQKGYEEDMERQQLEWEAYYNNMSVEDWSTLVDIIEEELEYQLRTFTDEDINAIFEEIYNEQYGTGRIETESTEGAQQSADSEGSNEIQPQQESDNETADGGSQIRPEETAASDEQGGSTLSEQNEKRLNNVFNYFTGSVKDLIEATKNKGSKLIKKIISPVSSRLIDELAVKGIIIDNTYNHTIDNNAINHAMNRHGSEKEKLSGQIPVTENDLENIADVIENYDSIETGKNKRGQDNIIYRKGYPDGITIYIEEVRTGRKELAMASIRKQKNGELTDANRQSTQISDLPPVSYDKDTKSNEIKQGYTVEKRYHKKDNKDIFAVNFTERMERDVFLDAKWEAKNRGGYYSSFGKGGFIFDTEDAARNFGKLIMAGIIGRNIGRAIENLKSLDNLPLTPDGYITIDGVNKAVLYHGTDSDNVNSIEDLEAGHKRADGEKATFNGDGIYFATERSTAEDYSGSNGKILTAYVKVKKPYITYGNANMNEQEAKQFTENLKKQGYDAIVNYTSLPMREAGVAPREIIVFSNSSIESTGNESFQSSLEAARAEVEQNPTEAQKEAGNYRKGHVTIDGYNITLENPKGSERSGTDKDGNKWSVTMNNDYGYIRGTEGVDGDHIDVFLSDTPESGKVFVVDQVNEDGSFDEHKVMYGFDTLEDAREAYLANYSPGWTGLGQITEVSKDQFKKWIGSSHRKTKPFAEYKSMITPKKPEEVNGYRKGDKVYYGGKPATIYDFEYDGRPVLDTGLAPVLYTIADWKDVTLDVSPITANFGKTLVNKSGETEIRIGKYDGDKQTVGVKINGEAQSMSVREVIGLLGSDEWSEVKEDKPAEKKSSGMQRVSVEGLFEDLKAKGTAKLSDNVVLSPIEQIKSNLDKEISKREKELDDIKSGKMPNTMYGNGSRRADLLRGEIREYKGKKQDIETLESLKSGVAYLGEGGKIITILSEKDGNYSYSVEIDGHSLELKATAEQMGNVVGMDDLRPDKLAPAKKEETAASQAPAYGSQNKVVSTARYEELRRKMREKLNNLNAGYDPELVAIGAEMAAYHVEAGARKFVDFAKRMLGDMGEEIRPYLKLFYNSVRDFPGMESYEAEMTPYEEVRNTDINNIKLTEDEQAETNTEAVISEAEAIAGEAEIVAATGTAEEIDKKIKDIDASLEKVNSQLALLGYYEADTSTPFHEVYGYAKSAEKKALADAKSFAKKLQKDLGVKEEKFSDKRRKLDSANIAPAGGSITVNIPLQQDRVLAIYIPIDIDRGTDDMFIPGGIMYRIESGSDFAGESNMYINEKSDYPTMLNAFRRLAKAYLPQQDKPVKVPVRNKSSKRSETLSVGDLFTNENDVSLQGETIKQTDNEQERRSETENKGLGKEAQQEDGKPVGDGMDRSSTGSVGSDKVGSGRSAVVSPVDGSGSTAGKRNERNNRNERAVDYAPKSPKARFDANIRAIKLMRELVASDAVATRQQMEVLRKFSGWGGLGTFFNNEDSAEYKKLRELLSDEEFDAAANSINSAYYTPSTVIDTLWDIAGKLGFKGGNILEGSAGIGNIIGSMPVSISENSSIEAVEIDPITGNILKLLYPDAKVNIQGFEDTRIRNGSVDLAITNVPFVTGLQVHDPIDKDLSRKFRNIHDFCIAKNVRKLREGGIGIFITSSGTMDKSTALREWLVNEGNADFIGAFRLNNKTFEGASVTSDIIVVRKRVGKSVSPAAIDAVNSGIVRTGEYPTGEKVWDKKSRSWVEETKTATMELNNYFQQHPENMAGEMAFNYEKGETRYPGSYALFPAKGKNQNTMLAEWVDTFQPLMEKGFQAQPATEEISTEEKNGALFADEKGNFYVSEMGVGVPLNLNANKVRGYEKTECLKDYNTLKSALDAVLQYQVASQDDAGLKPLIDKLNEAYDTFVSKYGSLNKNTSISFLRNDVDFPSVAAIEEYKEYTDLEDKKVVEINKTNVFKGRVIGFQAEPEPKTVKDGVIASIYKFGHIDLDYISDKLKRTPEDVKQTILSEGIGFVNPESGAVEVRYNYLSGNVRQKLQQAKENNENGEYTENIKALEQVMPLDIPAHLINFSLGSSWIDPALYADYIKDRFGVNSVSINHVEGIWNMKTTGYANEKNRSEGVYSEKFGEVIYGTELVEAALNNRTIQVKKVITHSDKTKETVVDKEATQACLNRIQEIKDDFKEWMHNKMLQDEELATNVAKVYNEKFNNLVPMVIDEMFLPAHFGGSSEAINLYTHQKRAVIRGTTEPLLLAHEVGSGKTFTLISTAMEMRRLGTAKKPMIVVQNATVGQFVADAKKLYPNAKVLTITERDRTPEGRRAFYGRIKYSDWDLIIVPQSTFDMIPDSPERQLTFIQEKIDEKQHAIEVMQEIEGDEIQIRQLENELTDLQVEYMQVSEKANEDKQPKKRDRKREEKTKQNIAARVKEQLDRKVDEVQYFDEMGIDAILVDEAHEYKRLGFSTAMTRGVKGIDPAGSKKAAGVYLKTRAVLEQNGWKNVIFATGTPISNTAAEIWTFMRYLMPKSVLKENEIYYFDDFVRNFGSITQSLEFATSGKFKENTRFAAYINKPELIRLWSSVSDTVLTKDIGYVNDKIPRLEKDTHQDIFLPQSDSLISIMNAVRAELERFENMSGKEKRENSHIPLTMYGIAKRAAIDTRLVDANAPDDPLSKTNKAVEETLRSLEETKEYKGTVAIFCDNQRRWDGNKVGFDLFEDIREKLIARGVPANQIIIMKPGMSVNKKQKIFDEVNAGSVRVVIGNTQTLGTGVNIQERLHTLIHMDAPDRPMDYTQRNGRILRQGNMHKVWNKPVRILRFGVEDSLDVTSYQRLKTKAAFIDSIMDGKAALANNQENRTLEEEEEGLFDNPVAILSGSQYALLKNQAEREYRKFLSKKSMYEADQIYVTNKLAKNKQQIETTKGHIEDNRQKLSKARELFPDGNVSTVIIEGSRCSNQQQIDEALKELVNKKVRALEDVARKDAYFRSQTLAFKLKFDGVDAVARVTLTRQEDYDFKLKATRITVRRGVTYDIPAMGIKDYTAPGGYVKSAIDDITQNIATGKAFSDAIDILTSSVTSMEAENELLSERKGKPFEFGKELEAAKEKVDEYTELMKAELAEKEAKYAGRGSESDIDLSEIETEEEEAEAAPEDDTRFRVDESEAEAMTYIIDSIHAEAAKLNIAVKVYTSLDQVPQGAARRAIERGLRVKGWHYKGDICVYLPYADGMDDIKATILHEGVAHFGLRKMVGEKNMNAFMDGIYAAASPELRKEIVKLLPRYNYDMHVAVEEYIATLVESGVIEPTFWEKVKQLFRTMLENLGFTVELTDNDLRYILWESRNNLLKSGNPVDVAKDTMMRKKLGIGMFGTRSPEETRFRTDKRAPLVEEYDAAIDNNAYRFQEAFQDSMLSLKVLQDLIEKQSGKPIRTFENAYTAENRLSSVNKVDNERYLEDFFKPLLSHIDKLAKMSDRNTVENYIYAKSGLERNEVFLYREADKVLKEKTEKLDKRLADKLISQKQYDKELQELKDAREKFIAEGKDYSGLTGLVLKEYEDELDSIEDDALRAKRQKEIEKEYKDHAEKIVSGFESMIPSAEVDKLWQLIKAANDENLRKQFDSGMISADRYEELRNMMQYYVPLRGWQESIAEDFYDYTRKESPVQKEKAAKGRKSLADNPIANIALSAQNAIILGNRNKMKQRFFNFIINRPNELVTIRDQWYARTLQTVHEQMEPVYPDIKETDDPDTIRQKLEDFETEMRQLEEAGLARRKKIPLGVELKMKSGQKPEHMVSVMINGQEYVMYINGNPRAAQALNGKTNPEGEENIFWEYYNKAKRLYGGGLTSNNPDFVAANFVRDSIHSATMQFLNNGLKSAALFVRNTPKSFNAVRRGVMGKYDPNSKTDQYFQEFIKYGGETGYTAIHTIEDYKREYEKALKQVKGIKAVAGAGKKGIEAAIKALEVANRIAEDVNRFNAYMSSREAGKTIEESIDAAKNITVNFNKKGSLGKGKGAWAALAWFMNKWILFFNPAVQGLYQVGQTTKKNRKRVAGTLATIAASGFIMPYFNAMLVSLLGGDDKDDYFYQTDYTRMNNWIFFTGNGYFKVPLPPFFREIYGMGDILHRLLTNRITPERAAVATMRQLQSAIGFINLIPEGEPSVKEAVSGIMPDIIAPLMDVALNRDFTGRDIAKDTEWTKYLPEYERIYKGVSPVYVEFSRLLNDVLGGDDARKATWFGDFINPAYMEHIITSYTGGIGKTISNLAGAAADIATGEADNIEFRTIPVINRFGSPVTERSITASVNRVFYDYLDRYEAMKVAEKRYKAFIKDGRTDFRKELEQMKKNGESELIRYFDAKMKVLRKKQNLLKENPDNKDLEKQIIELKSEMVLKAKKILE